jgi:pimeloyl-ACP methyl ester carboxylesterase
VNFTTAGPAKAHWEDCVKPSRLLIVLLLLPLALEAQTSPAPIGKMVDLGGHRLHLHCTGRGTPTVVVEMGFEEYSFDWLLVQDAVAKFTRICTYDRAGYAWSDSGPLPRSFGQINLELRTALEKTGEQGPYVFVGHSYGGGPVRNFALTYPKQTVGLVFVDIVSENQRIQMGPKNTGLISDSATHKPIPEPHLDMTAKDRVEPPKVELEKPTIEPPFDKLPPDVQKLHLWAMAKMEMQMAAMSEREWSAEYMAKWRAAPQAGTLGALPLIVLTRAEGGFGNDLDVPAAELERQRKQAQSDLAKLSTRGKFVLVPSGHNMQVEAPDAVVKAIQEVITESKH